MSRALKQDLFQALTTKPRTIDDLRKSMRLPSGTIRPIVLDLKAEGSIRIAGWKRDASRFTAIYGAGADADAPKPKTADETRRIAASARGLLALALTNIQGE